MTYELEIQIEELGAELRNAVDVAERRQIQAELELAQAERPSRLPRWRALSKPSRLSEVAGVAPDRRS